MVTFTGSSFAFDPSPLATRSSLPSFVIDSSFLALEETVPFASTIGASGGVAFRLSPRGGEDATGRLVPVITPPVVPSSSCDDLPPLVTSLTVDLMTFVTLLVSTRGVSTDAEGALIVDGGERDSFTTVDEDDDESLLSRDGAGGPELLILATFVLFTLSSGTSGPAGDEGITEGGAGGGGAGSDRTFDGGGGPLLLLPRCCCCWLDEERSWEAAAATSAA